MKKVLKLGIILALCIGFIYIGKICVELGKAQDDRYANANGEEEKEIIEALENGTSYTYTDEELAVFKEEAHKLMEYEIEKYDMKVGEFRIRKLMDDRLYDFRAEIAEREGRSAEELITEMNESYAASLDYYSKDPSNPTYVVYSRNSSIEKILNEDLSLVDPYVFYGYTSVTDPTEKLNSYIQVGAPNSEFTDFVHALQMFDKDAKDNSSTSIVKLIQLNSDYLDTIWKHKDFGVGYAQNKEWASEEKENSMNPLQRHLKYNLFRGPGFDAFVYDPETWKKLNKENLDYTPYPEEYNYWVQDEINYFTVFYPTAITKIDEFTYIVDIETEKPVDRYGANLVVHAINCRFLEESGDFFYNGENYLKIIIRIGDEIYHNMNSGIASKEVLYKYASSCSPSEALVEWKGWTPSSEARPWVNTYFSIAAEAYENDSYFSIFETIDTVAEMYDVDATDVESVIMTVYWIFCHDEWRVDSAY